ncbi:hypothetical protein Kkor_0415 [Kangiella koreensis DSM 16069]|uniref:Uncharacterized protein n=1 Tax=Kangiella koreensis (strain DSM 16069 / JCM 12317 / KCTC 12182 / SW-125) TaxID=523791 RepID=C7R853_KANKD|nr:hypothetical protein Kkor_0415 [Kangiella koreensis DSM 16069]
MEKTVRNVGVFYCLKLSEKVVLIGQPETTTSGITPVLPHLLRPYRLSRRITIMPDGNIRHYWRMKIDSCNMRGLYRTQTTSINLVILRQDYS